MQEVQFPLPIGSLVRGHYLIERLLGKGCSSAVYLVSDQRIKHTLPHQFALKEIVALNKGERSRLILEGASLRRLRHQGFPRIYYVFNDGHNGRVYLLMEYIEGTSLEALRQQRPEKRLSWLEAVSLMAPLIDAVCYLHSQSPLILHRDIKPTNIIVSEARTVLVDFGMIGKYDPNLPPAVIRSFALAYRAPELYKGEIGTRTDVYGLGATFYTLVSGMVPVDALSRIAQLGNGESDSLKQVNEVIPSIPGHVAEVIDRAISVYAHERFSSVELFWEALWSPKRQRSPVPSGVPLVVSLHPNASKRESSAARPTTVTVPDHQPHIPRTRKHVAPWPFARKRIVEQSEIVSTPKRWRVPHAWKSGIVLAFLALLVGLGVVVGFSSHVVHNRAAPLLAVTSPVSRPTHAPPVVLTTYPLIEGRYAGTIDDVSSNVSTSLSLIGVQQGQGKISGYLMLGSGLQGSGSFSGTIDTAKHIQFTVTDAAGHVTFFFEGAIQSAISLSGNYYQCSPNPTPNSQCSRTSDGYGIWSAVLVS